jgi:hypothetical protein
MTRIHIVAVKMLKHCHISGTALSFSFEHFSVPVLPFWSNEPGGVTSSFWIRLWLHILCAEPVVYSQLQNSTKDASQDWLGQIQ